MRATSSDRTPKRKLTVWSRPVQIRGSPIEAAARGRMAGTDRIRPEAGGVPMATTGKDPVVGTTAGTVLAHDYLTQRGGAERVALSLARAFPRCSPAHHPLRAGIHVPPSSPTSMCGRCRSTAGGSCAGTTGSRFRSSRKPCRGTRSRRTCSWRARAGGRTEWPRPGARSCTAMRRRGGSTRPMLRGGSQGATCGRTPCAWPSGSSDRGCASGISVPRTPRIATSSTRPW